MMEPQLPEEKSLLKKKKTYVANAGLKRLQKTEETGVNIRKEEEQLILDFDKMQKEVKLNHPTNSKGQRFTKSEICCGTDTGNQKLFYNFKGRHGCYHSSEKGSFDRFGVGVALYFRFLKYIGCLFIFLGIIASPIVIFGFFSASDQEIEINTYQEFLFATTLGSIGASTKKCSLTKIANLSKIEERITEIKCYSGQIDEASYTYGLVTNQADSELACYLIGASSISKSCNNDTVFKSDFEAACKGKSNCTFLMSPSYFDSGCSLGNPNKFSIHFNVFCKNQQLPLPKNKTISKGNLALLIACLDAVIVIFYLIFVMNLKACEKKAANNIMENTLTPALFTLEVKNLPEHLNKEDLISKIWDHFETVMIKKYSKRKKPIAFRVIDVQLAESNELITLSDNQGDLVKEKNMLVRKWAKLYDVEKSLPDIVYLTDLTNAFQRVPANEKAAAKKLLTKIEKTETKTREITKKIIKFTNDPAVTFKSAWITFETMKQKDLAYHEFFSTNLEQCFNTCCSCCMDSDRRFFEKKFLKVDYPPDPTNIQWHNLNASNMNKRIRRAISLIITIGLLILTLALLVKIKLEQEKLKSTYPKVNCKLQTMQNITEQMVIDESHTNIKKGYTNCFCMKDLVKRLNLKFTDDKFHCQEWFKAKTLSLFLPFAMVICIVFVNLVMQTLFKLLSKFEKHEYLSEEFAARVIKIFISQFLNTGIVIMLINLRFQGNGFFEQLNSVIKGKYPDISSEWYKNVGITVLLTMFINVFSTPCTVLIWHFIRICKRKCDQGCSGDPKKTKKKKQKAYEALYMGPEFMIDFRYAQVLTIIFVCLLYSPGIPILYFTTSFQIFITYWIDKYFVCRIPKNIDEKLEEIVQGTLKAIVVIHLIFAIWIYGNPSIFYDKVTFSAVYSAANYANEANKFISSSNQGGYIQEFGARFIKPQNYILDALLVGFLFLFLLIFILYRPLRSCLEVCCQKFSKKKFFSLGNKFSNEIMLRDEIKNDSKIIKVYLKENTGIIPKYKARLENRKKDLKNELKTRGLNSKVELMKGNQKKFIGIFSYDIKHNPTYKEIFAIDEKVEDIKSEEFQDPTNRL